jgi:hypothetical protein
MVVVGSLAALAERGCPAGGFPTSSQGGLRSFG